MNILGITCTKDAGATLIKNGLIVAACNEERFTRIKNDQAFPIKSINACLNLADLAPSDIDHIALGAGKGIEPAFMPQYIARICEIVAKNPNAGKIIAERCYHSIKGDLDLHTRSLAGIEDLGLKCDMSFVDHHTAHAYSTYYCSPFDRALIVTLDGRGDGKCMTLWLASRNQEPQLLESVPTFDGFGHYFGLITLYLGFRPNRHEGKVLGLAAYGNPDTCLPTMQKMIGLENGTIKASIGDYYHPHKAFLPGRLKQDLDGHSREDVAAAAQHWMEYCITEYLRPLIFKYDVENICLAGGVFANVKLNQRIMELEGVENIYIHPHMGDGGAGTGAALYAHQEFDNAANIARPLTSARLGPTFDTTKIALALDKHNLHYSEEATPKAIAELIADNNVVGLFNGRLEYGPRALGARSILASATDKQINDTLNKRLSRSDFMPFAPATLENRATEYYDNWHKDHIASWFMTLTYNCTELAKETTPAVVHVDGTARPQVIKRDHYPFYYDIIHYYELKTGISSVINTSFNHHEEPIVCTPEDAIRSFLKDNVDVLAMPPFLIRSK